VRNYSKFLRFLALGFSMVAIAVIIMVSLPARAEEDMGENAVVTDMRGVNRYHWWFYPTSHAFFALPNNYETRFDVHNGLFWELFYREFKSDYRAMSGDLDVVHMQIDVSFYTPRGEFIGKYDRIEPNYLYSIPHNKKSFEFDRLQVKVENHSRFNREVRFVVVDGADEIKGTPIPGVYREP